MPRHFKPAVFNVAMKLLVPVESYSYGVLTKTYSEPANSETIFGSFKTFGGTENIQDGVFTLIDTAVVNTWYRPDITADCRIYICDTGAIYEIAGEPEDIALRHQYMQFHLRKVGGKA